MLDRSQSKAATVLSVLSTEQTFALVDETERAVELAHHGIQSLWSLDAANDRYHLPLVLLAQGIERLLKLTYVLGVLESTSQIPTSAQIKKFGHDLLVLTDEVVKIARGNNEFAARPAIASDLAFVDTDQDLRAMLRVLSDFGKQGRYHNLDILLAENPSRLGQSPEEAWQQLESDFLARHPEWKDKLGTPEFSTGWYQALAADVTEVLQRFLRAVCRMWTLGPLGEHGKQLTGTINRFLFLTDDRLRFPRHPTRDQ